MNAQAASRTERIEDRLARRGGLVELLRPLSWLYAAVVRLRNAAYDHGLLPAGHLDVPVVCVGNLTTGGTGKTPLVAWVCRELQQRCLRPGVLSRGYRARAGAASDEAELLARALPDVPHVQDSDRLRGGARLIEAHRVDCVVLDDGFQHRRLQRDLDLVLVDASRPWGLPAPGTARGAGRAVRALLPRGLLREPPGALARAHACILTRTDQVPPDAVEALAAELGELAPACPLARASHRPQSLRDATGADVGLEALFGRDVDLVSGIGNPAAFEATVVRLGARVGEHRAFPDHHAFAPGDLEGLGADGRWIVATTKDAPKLPAVDSAVVILAVEMHVEEGAAVLAALLDSLPVGRTTRERRALHEGLHG